MGKVDEAKVILAELGLPRPQQTEIASLTLLALCNVVENTPWSSAQRISLTISKGIMLFMEEKYKKRYAPNTRETVRRQVLHQFVQARLADYNPDSPGLPVNSPRAHYAISDKALQAIQTFGTPKWTAAKAHFIEFVGKLSEKYSSPRDLQRVPVLLPGGKEVVLSPGKHNLLQAGIVSEFAPRFVGGAKLLYLGDTEDKVLYFDRESFSKLHVLPNEHSKLPDIVLFEERKNWLVLVEAVTSHGPMSPKRIEELSALLSGCRANLIFVSAFLDFGEFKRHMSDIAWETEVWIAECPDHLVHFNGDKFLGPHKS